MVKVLSSPDQYRTAQSLNDEAANGVEAGINEMIVIAFEKGRFLTSLEFTVVTREKNEYFTFTQEVVDKSKIKDIANCTDYTKEAVQKFRFSSWNMDNKFTKQLKVYIEPND